MITKTYIDLLKYVSASGKTSLVETIRPCIKKGAGMKYLGPLEYKSIPIGMPRQRYGFKFEQWEKIVQEGGGTKGSTLKSWFDFLTPKRSKLSRVEKEIENCFKRENLDKIEFFKTLSPQERSFLSKRQYIDTDEFDFFATLSGYKPAWFCENGFEGKVDFSKIKLNPKIADKYDVVKLPQKIQENPLYFLNKQEVLKIIEKNKDVYCAAQGLSPSEDLEVIYQTLLHNLEQGTAGETLFGMTLGFPRHSSMIYELDQMLGSWKSGLRKDIPLFRTKLLELLHSDKSPFKGYPKETLERLESHIKSMKSVSNTSQQQMCQCIIFGNEKEAVNELLILEDNFKRNFSIKDLM